MPDHGSQHAHATPETGVQTAVWPEAVEPRLLPMYRVILHNDDVNDMVEVVESIVSLTHLNQQEAIERTLEAHYTGCSLLLVIHKERAELYMEQFRSCRLTVTIEPDE